MFFLGLAHPPQTKSILSSLGRRDPIEAKGFENSKQFGTLALPLHKASLGISCLRELRSFARVSIRILTGGAQLRITKCWALPSWPKQRVHSLSGSQTCLAHQSLQGKSLKQQYLGPTQVSPNLGTELEICILKSSLAFSCSRSLEKESILCTYNGILCRKNNDKKR